MVACFRGWCYRPHQVPWSNRDEVLGMQNVPQSTSLQESQGHTCSHQNLSPLEIHIRWNLLYVPGWYNYHSVKLSKSKLKEEGTNICCVTQWLGCCLTWWGRLFQIGFFCLSGNAIVLKKVRCWFHLIIWDTKAYGTIISLRRRLSAVSHKIKSSVAVFCMVNITSKCQPPCYNCSTFIRCVDYFIGYLCLWK